MTADRYELLKRSYLYVFDNFAISKSDLAAHLGISKNYALKILVQLEQSGLICRFDVNEESQGISRRGQFKELVWQSWRTYDNYSRSEVEEYFLEHFAIVIDGRN